MPTDFQAVKGTRDFYPELMRLRNWIADAWRRVSLRNGFEEYDAPIFEYLDLFTVKSGEEIVEQLFSFTDRGGRELAIRPEITPSLARMVNAKINSLPRPMKWFSIPRLCRAEKPQKGRLREFFQWNVDIVGSDDLLADAECIFVAVDFLREIGLTAEDVVVRIGSRALTTAYLGSIGVAAGDVEKVIPVLDKRPKVERDEFVRIATAAGLDETQIEAVERFQDAEDLDAVAGLCGEALAEDDPALRDLQELWDRLGDFGIQDYCRMDMEIVRGLAYYTGIVYEVFDRRQSLRAVAGGGRYDNLLEVLGGPQVGATGFGMGDVVLSILLEENGKLPNLDQELDFFIIDDGAECLTPSLKLVSSLRAGGWRADYSFKRQKTPKQLKEALKRGAAVAIFVKRDPEAFSPDGFVLTVKNLRNEKQYPSRLFVNEFLERPELRNVRDIDQFIDRFGLADG